MSDINKQDQEHHHGWPQVKGPVAGSTPAGRVGLGATGMTQAGGDTPAIADRGAPKGTASLPSPSKNAAKKGH